MSSKERKREIRKLKARGKTVEPRITKRRKPGGIPDADGLALMSMIMLASQGKHGR